MHADKIGIDAIQSIWRFYVHVQMTKMQCRSFFKYTHRHESMKAYNVVDNKVLRVEITVSF